MDYPEICDKHKFNDARTRINYANTFGYLMFKLFLLFHLPSNVVSILRVTPAPASFTIFWSAVEMQDVSKRSPNTCMVSHTLSRTCMYQKKNSLEFSLWICLFCSPLFCEKGQF